MTTSDALSADVRAELLRRHKSTATTVLSLLVAVVLLCVLAFVSQKFLTQRNNPPLDIAVRISILMFGLGAIALRRTKFAKMRLQDIAAVQGIHGLLTTLQRTTLLVALIGVAILHTDERRRLVYLPGRSGCGRCSFVRLSRSQIVGTGYSPVPTHRLGRGNARKAPLILNKVRS